MPSVRRKPSYWHHLYKFTYFNLKRLKNDSRPSPINLTRLSVSQCDSPNYVKAEYSKRRMNGANCRAEPLVLLLAQIADRLSCCFIVIVLIV